MGPEAVTELNALVEQFPYFQPAHLLLSIAARRWDAATYQRTLKKTAIVGPDRARLFELIMQAEQWDNDPEQASPEARKEDGLTLLKVAEQVSENRELPPAPQAEQERGDVILDRFARGKAYGQADNAQRPDDGAQ